MSSSKSGIAIANSVLWLQQIRDGDLQRWQRLVDYYVPTMYETARRKGCTREQAQTLVGNIFRDVLQELQQEAGTESTKSILDWLNHLLNQHLQESGFLAKREDAAVTPGGDWNQTEASDNSDWSAAAEHNHQRRVLLHVVVAKLKESLSETERIAFEQTVVKRESPQTVAESLNLSIGEVCSARYQALRKLRAELTWGDVEDDEPASSGQ